MEWEGEYRRYRHLYRAAYTEAQKGGRLILLAEQDGAIIGQIIARFGSDLAYLEDGSQCGYLYSFRVRPLHRNQGVGTRLIQAAEAALRCRQYGKAVIAAAIDNVGARRLYERLGYQVLTEDPGEWSYIDDRGRMRWVAEPSFIFLKVV
jgi:ribosomal protein S18 acetylase RimI-like enzyme